MSGPCGGAAHRLITTERVDLPVVEASGLAVRTVGDLVQVLVVGDRTAHVGVGVDSPAGVLGDWRVLDLSDAIAGALPPDDSQLEAVATDGGSLVALMSEDPPVVLVVDTTARTLRARIDLVAPPGSPLDGHWDDSSSRGEGLVLLRGGRLLVAKEKRPAALVEFAPVGSEARGLSRNDFLDDGESWEAPDGEVSYAAVAMWPLGGSAKKAIADISALGVGRDRSLWMLSDKSRRLSRLSLASPLEKSGGKIRELQEIWRLPKGIKKPEGVVALDEERILVALDTNSTQRNGVILRRPESDRT